MTGLSYEALLGVRVDTAPRPTLPARPLDWQELAHKWHREHPLMDTTWNAAIREQVRLIQRRESNTAMLLFGVHV